ncbi:MAG: efflux RND transporter periplasmic adaptor subunit [Psychrosphaera sp.]|nr:efflux RND transporter periplasmic adaptor subunit [Psychrosphaera sp.]
MDIKVTKKTNKFAKNLPIILVALGIALLLVWRFVNMDDRKSISRQNNLFAQVQRGELILTVDGYGALKSNDQKLLTAVTQATIEEIVLKPGAKVKADSVVLRLNNPEIVMLVENAMRALEREKANFKQIELSQQRELLKEQVKLAELEAEYELIKLNLNARKDLVKTGVVSKLSMKEAQIKEQQVLKITKIYENQATQLTLLHSETLKMQLERIKQSEGNLKIAQRKQTSLTVVAGMEGVLQKSFIELGQNVSIGQQLALISGTKNLVALLKIPQTQVDLVKLGQSTTIDTRKGIVTGRVHRIDPAVSEGTVTVEIELTGELPRNARPELSIDGTIHIETIANATYIERPANIQPNSDSLMFEVTGDSTDANAKYITFGAETGKYIQILSSVGEQAIFIISDMSAYHDVKSVLITQ